MITRASSETSVTLRSTEAAHARRYPERSNKRNCLMKKYEYKSYYLKFETGKPRKQHILDVLNNFGNDGWRLNRLTGELGIKSILSFMGGVNLLLEREVQEK